MTMPTDERGAIVAPAQRDLGEFAASLEAWLRTKLSAERVRVTDPTYPRGSGQSHETILFIAEWADARGSHVDKLVARVKPTVFTVFQDDMFDEQYRLMRVLHETGRVRVAPTLWFEADPTILGAPFFVMEQIEGRVAVTYPPYMDSGWVAEATPAQRDVLWRNCITELASVQSVPVEAVPFLSTGATLSGFDQEWDRWTRFLDVIDRPARPAALHRRVWDELRRTWPAHRPEGIVWGDARIGNIMVDDQFEVVALMDWEQPSLGGAMHDLGWWLFNQRTKIDERDGRSLDGITSWADTVALWSERTGLPGDDIEWYEAFAAFKTACLATNMQDMRQPEAVGEVALTRHLRLARDLTGV